MSEDKTQETSAPVEAKEEVKQVDKGPEVRPISFEDALKELRDLT